MLESITNLLDSCKVQVQDASVIVLTESSGSCFDAIITHFLCLGVSRKYPVCFVTFNQTWGHFSHLGGKMGVNLRQQAEQGRIKVIEGLKLALNDMVSESAADQSFGFLSMETFHPLKNLYRLVKHTVEPWRSKGQFFLLVIDDLSSLLSLGVSVEETETFAHYCSTLVSHISHHEMDVNHVISPPMGLLICGVTDEEQDSGACRVRDSLVNRATYHLSMTGLITGKSREVHGDLTVRVFDNVHVPSVQKFQYKMEDKLMKIFAPGTAVRTL